MGAGPVAEPVGRLLAGLGPQQRGVGHMGVVVGSVDLEDQPDPARDQFLLVGLHPEPQRHQVGSFVAAPRLDPLDALLEPLAEGLRGDGEGRTVGAGRRTA